MKIITRRKEGMKIKAQKEKGSNKMKRMVMAILVAAVLINASNAFAYWKASAGMEIKDPAPSPFETNLY